MDSKSSREKEVKCVNYNIHTGEIFNVAKYNNRERDNMNFKIKGVEFEYRNNNIYNKITGEKAEDYFSRVEKNKYFTNDNKISSVFKQETYKRIYHAKPQLLREYRYTQNNVAICSLDSVKSSRYESKLIKSEIILDTELSQPILSVGDNFYIKELDKTVTIDSVFRTSDNGILYLVNPIYIDDEESLKIQNDLIEEEHKEFNWYKNRYEELKDLVNQHNKKQMFKRFKIKID